MLKGVIGNIKLKHILMMLWNIFIAYSLSKLIGISRLCSVIHHTYFAHRFPFTDYKFKAKLSDVRPQSYFSWKAYTILYQQSTV